MAYIDKTYFSTYEQWKQVRDWCDDKIVEFSKTQIYHVKYYLNYIDLTEVEFDSYKEEFVKSYCKNYNTTREEALNNFSMVLWNTPVWLDIWLIRNCPIDFIQDRLKYQYGKDYELIKQYRSIYDTYKRNGLGKHFHYKVICKPNWHPRFNITIRTTFDTIVPFKEKKHSLWFVRVKDKDDDVYWWYDTRYDYWTNTLEAKPYDSDTMILRKKNLNIHSIIRLLKKWDLPANSRVIIENRYFNYQWIIDIKK